uniref:Placenta-expressed transcript 1 protein n=1 Tax=Panagrellus redivivus TaxID=6233 RepID=A0A7E4ZXY6_PANRE
MNSSVFVVLVAFVALGNGLTDYDCQQRILLEFVSNPTSLFNSRSNFLQISWNGALSNFSSIVGVFPSVFIYSQIELTLIISKATNACNGTNSTYVNAVLTRLNTTFPVAEEIYGFVSTDERNQDLTSSMHWNHCPSSNSVHPYKMQILHPHIDKKSELGPSLCHLALSVFASPSSLANQRLYFDM